MLNYMLQPSQNEVAASNFASFSGVCAAHATLRLSDVK